MSDKPASLANSGTKAKQVVDPAVAAEVPPAPAPEAKPAQVATFWIYAPRKVKFEDGTEIVFAHNKLVISDERAIKNLEAMVGEKHRLWRVS